MSDSMLDGLWTPENEYIYIITMQQLLYSMATNTHGIYRGYLLPSNFLCDHWPVDPAYFPKFILCVNLKRVIWHVKYTYDDEGARLSSHELEENVSQALTKIKNQMYLSDKLGLFDTKEAAQPAIDALTSLVKDFPYKEERLERELEKKKRYDDTVKRSLEATAYLHRNNPPEMLAETLSSFEPHLWPEHVRNDTAMVSLINEIKKANDANEDLK